MQKVREARAALSAVSITAGQDFDSLTPDQLAAVTAEAEKVYRAKTGKPLSAASKSFVRKRYELLQQRAAQ
jgi:hypothetical protein